MVTDKAKISKMDLFDQVDGQGEIRVQVVVHDNPKKVQMHYRPEGVGPTTQVCKAFRDLCQFCEFEVVVVSPSDMTWMA